MRKKENWMLLEKHFLEDIISAVSTNAVPGIATPVCVLDHIKDLHCEIFCENRQRQKLFNYSCRKTLS